MNVAIRHSPSFAVARVGLDPGESLRAESGAMMASVGDRQLGQEGLSRVLSDCAGRPAAEVVETVAEAVLSAQRHQRDDVGILALQARRP